MRVQWDRGRLFANQAESARRRGNDGLVCRGALMARLRVFPRFLWVAAALLLAACAASGPGVKPGFDGFSSIFNEDLSARQPSQPGATVTAQNDIQQDQQTVRGLREAVYLGTGEVDPSGQTVSSFEPGDVTLNFENADIREVVQSILGNTLGENYVIDPNVAGSVTVSSARPIAKDDLPQVLEIILQMNGAALIRDGQTYRVTLEGSGVASTADVGDARAGYGISILPLRHVSAQTLISLIDGFGVRPGSVRAEAARNLLIVLGNSADRRSAIETAMTFDADWMQDQAVAILPLRHAKPEAIIPELERIFSSRQGGVGQDLIQFMPMQRLKAVLVVSPRRNVINNARVWIQRLDTENPDLNANVVVYRVKYRDAKKLAPLLSSIFSGSGGGLGESPSDQIEPGGDAVTSDAMTSGFNQDQGQAGGPGDPNQDLIANAATPGDEQVDPTIVGEPGGAETPTGGQVRIQADVANNSLVIYANLEMREQILKALERIDVPQLQVAINVTMAEIRLTDELRYGIQYFLKSQTFGLGSNKGLLSLFAGNATGIGQVAPGFNFVLGSAASPDIIIDAFDGITDVQVLSSPSLVVVENETAKFQVGDQIPIVTRTVTSVQDPEAPVSNEVEYRDTGIILNIKPRIAENGVVTLDIGQEISNVASGAASLTPVISTRTVKSQIAVVDGQTVLLGGLISEQGSRDRSGIPGLHRMRGIGGLFGRRSYLNNRTELIILIRPSVIRGSEDAQTVAEELRSRLWGLGASQAR
jgi:general secretion pathway protein D